MKIGFWLTTPKRFDPRKVDETPFGGAEMSAINLAKELARKRRVSDNPSKHDMNVYREAKELRTDCVQAKFSHSPIVLLGNIKHAYLAEDSFIHFMPYSDLKLLDLDILIVVRADQNLLNPRRNHLYFVKRPKHILLWTGDAYDQPNNQILHDTYAVRDIDLVIAKSNWQKETLLQHFPLLKKVEVMYNGVPDDIPEATYTESPRFVYASTAYRGLYRFLDIWPKIKERIPDATLDCYCKTTLYLDDNPRECEFESLYDEILAMEGTSIKEPLPQKEFHKALTQYYAMLYPNSGFVESSCGVVLEAMCIGLPVIAPKQHGLGETLELCTGYDWFTCKLDLSDFVSALLKFKEWDDGNGDGTSSREKFFTGDGGARSFNLSQYSWSKVAQRWENLLFRITGKTEDKIFQESSSAYSPEVVS